VLKHFKFNNYEVDWWEKKKTSDFGGVLVLQFADVDRHRVTGRSP
jgi:hypothetical protein